MGRTNPYQVWTERERSFRENTGGIRTKYATNGQRFQIPKLYISNAATALQDQILHVRK